jgi:hypothetical protein
LLTSQLLVVSKEQNKNITKKIQRNHGFDKTIAREGASRWRPHSTAQALVSS